MLDRIRNFFTPARRKAIYVAATAAGVVLVTLNVVTPEQIDGAVRAVVHALRLSGERELPSLRVGEFVMAELKKLDQVAYVRFASVYRKFQDIEEFREEIARLERDMPGLAAEQLPLLDDPKKS